MEQSKGFVDLKEMIEKDLSAINISDFDQLLKQFKEEEDTTSVAHQTLVMQLAGNNVIKPKRAATKKKWFQMINNANLQYTEWEVEIAKRIACIVVSYQVGVPF